MGYVDTTALVEDASPDVGLFAAPAFFITLRETLEAAIIVAVLLGLLKKLEIRHLSRYIWLGVGFALIISIVLAVIVLILVNVAKEELFEGSGENIMEGVLSIVAALMIGYVAASIGNIMGKTKKWEARLTHQVEEARRRAEAGADAEDEEGNFEDGGEEEEAISGRMIFFLTFTAVLREGVETIIFFTAIGSAYPPKSLPIPAIVGAVVGLLLGVLLYRFGSALALRIFFKFTMVLLVFIGAGVFVNGVSSLEYAGNCTTGICKPLYDISDCCSTDNEFWLMMRVLFGYQYAPSALLWIMYLLFHAVTWTVIYIKHKRAAHEMEEESEQESTSLSTVNPAREEPSKDEV